MTRYQLRMELISDTTFGRGDGVAGLVDQETEHDRYGMPYLRGRTLKGLLSEECDNLINNLPEANKHYWQQQARQLFGFSGSGMSTIAQVHFGDACLPNSLRQALAYQIDAKRFTRAEILDSLTTIRRQTAIEAKTGVADEGSLRSLRVAVRELVFIADLLLDDDTSSGKTTDSETTQTDLNDSLTLLLIGTKALRYVGSGRNRGRGHVCCTLLDDAGNLLSPAQETKHVSNFFDAQKVPSTHSEVV